MNSNAIVSSSDKTIQRLFERVESLCNCYNKASYKRNGGLDILLTEDELCSRLKVSRRTLLDYRREGILPYIQLGGLIRYKLSDVIDLLDRNYCRAFEDD